MNWKLAAQAGFLGLVLSTQAFAQDKRVYVMKSRPYTPADTTGLIHAPTTLTETRTIGLPRTIGDCAPHLRDSAQNIDFRLIASFTASSVTTSGDTVFTYKTTYGDYRPETKRAYGLAEGEVVRVDCSRNRPVGKARLGTAPAPK